MTITPSASTATLHSDCPFSSSKPPFPPSVAQNPNDFSKKTRQNLEVSLFLITFAAKSIMMYYKCMTDYGNNNY